MIRLQLPRGAKPSKAAGRRDNRRPVLENAQIVQQDDGLELRVTDSYIAARIPLTTDLPLNGDVLPELISAATLAAWERSKNGADVEDGTLTIDGATYAAADGQFPNLDNIWPEPYPRTFTVGVDVAKLYALSQAIGCSEVKLTFNADSPARPVLVETLNLNGAHGIFMPKRLDDQGLSEVTEA